VSRSEKKQQREREKERERRSERQVHHGDTPSIILRREREREGGREGGREGEGRTEVSDGGAKEREREKDLSHECCVWNSFMAVCLNSRSESFENGIAPRFDGP